MKKIVYLITVILFFNYFSIAEPLNIETIISQIEKSYDSVKDYSCIIYKKELIDGKYFEKKNIFYKYLKPNYYYMKWTEGDDSGMEVIYAEKKYKNNLRVHLGGVMSFIDVEIDPLGDKALNENRHNIFESDLGFIIKLLRKNHNLAVKHKINTIKFIGHKMIDKNQTLMYEAIFPKDKNFYSHKIQIFINPSIFLPVKLNVFNWDSKLIESYYFSDIKINNGFTDFDFDVENPDYKY